MSFKREISNSTPRQPHSAKDNINRLISVRKLVSRNCVVSTAYGHRPALFSVRVPPFPVSLNHVDEHPLVLALPADLRRPRQTVVHQEKAPPTQKVYHLKIAHLTNVAGS